MTSGTLVYPEDSGLIAPYEACSRLKILVVSILKLIFPSKGPTTPTPLEIYHRTQQDATGCQLALCIFSGSLVEGSG